MNPKKNRNLIWTEGFSNPETENLYSSGFKGKPELKKLYDNGWQCGGCGFYAELNDDWGLCFNSKSVHKLETVFEHFTCRFYLNEGWGCPHSLGKMDKSAISEHQIKLMKGNPMKRKKRR